MVSGKHFSVMPLSCIHSAQMVQANNSKRIEVEALDFLNFALSPHMDNVVNSARQSA